MQKKATECASMRFEGIFREAHVFPMARRIRRRSRQTLVALETCRRSCFADYAAPFWDTAARLSLLPTRMAPQPTLESGFSGCVWSVAPRHAP
jgi:hypothetical protein